MRIERERELVDRGWKTRIIVTSLVVGVALFLSASIHQWWQQGQEEVVQKPIHSEQSVSAKAVSGREDIEIEILEPASSDLLRIRQVRKEDEKRVIKMAADYVIGRFTEPRFIRDDERDQLLEVGLSFVGDAGFRTTGEFRLLLNDPLDPQAVELALRNAEAIISDLDFVEPDFLIQAAEFPPGSAPLLRAGGLWSLHSPLQATVDIDAPEAWDIRHDAPDAVVAVIDSGIDTAHTDLAGNLWTHPSEVANGLDDDGNGFVDDLHGADLINGESPLVDLFGHGTHVAGVIGADAAVHGLAGETTGIAWRCQLMGLKVLDGSGIGTVSGAVRAIDYAIGHAATIMNLSWTTAGESVALRLALLRARAAGILCVTPAGNDGQNLDVIPVFPASFGLDNVLAVNSIGRSGELSTFSNYSARFVSVAAPGESIRSTLPGSRAGVRSGTSAAAAHVTGVLALIRAQFPGEHWLQHRHRLENGAVFDESLHGSCTLSARLNARKSLEPLTVQALPPFDAFAKAHDAGTSRYFSVTFNNSFATAEAAEPLHTPGGGRSLWFSWTVPAGASHPVKVHIADNGASDFRGVVRVYQGTSLADLTLVAAAEHGQSATFSPDSERHYYIAVDSQASSAGGGILVMEQPAQNDNLAQAELLTGNRWKVITSNEGATMELREPPHAGSTAAASLWWKWKAPMDGYFRVATEGSAFDTTLAVYDGQPVAASIFSSARPHVVFVLDTSSSSRRTFRGGTIVADVNRDGSNNTVLDAEIAAAKTLTALLAAEAPEAVVSIVRFDFQATQVDLDPAAAGLQGVMPVSAGGKNAIEAALEALRSDGEGTNIEASLQQALSILNTQAAAAATGEIILLSDGKATRGGSFRDEAVAIRNAGYEFRALGPGASSDLSGLHIATGEASIFQSPEELLGLGWNVVASNDSSNAGETSELIFLATAGSEYFVAVDGYAGQVGEIHLSGSYGTTMQLLSQSSDIIIKRNDRLSLSVNVESEERVYYQWYRDGLPIFGANSTFYNVRIADVGDAGIYHVTMANGIQSLTSDSIAVSIQTGAPQISSVQPLFTVLPEGRVDISAAVETFRFPVNYRWFFNGELLPDAPNFNQLTILKVGSEHEGIYRLEATTEFGTELSAPMEVRISAPGLTWEKIQPRYPVDDLTGGGQIGERYFLGGQRGRIHYSDDQQNWKEASVPAAPESVRYWIISNFDRIGDRAFAFISYPSLPPEEEQGGLWSIDNGETWTWDTNIPYISKILRFDDRILGVQTNGGRLHQLFETVDGSTWTPLSLPRELVDGTLPQVGNGIMLVFNGERVFTTTDARTWDSEPSGLNFGVSSDSVFFGRDQFHVIDMSARRRYSSTNGEAWTESGEVSQTFHVTRGNLSFPGGHFLFADSGTYASEDLLEWNEVRPGFSGGSVGDDGSYILWGRTLPAIGTDLSLLDHGLSLNGFSNIRELNGVLFVNDGQQQYKSLDGENWQADPQVFNDGDHELYAAGIYVRGTNVGHLPLEYSHDGVNWNASSFAGQTTATVNEIAYGDHTFVAVFDDGGILRSENGIDWSIVREFDESRNDLSSVSFHHGAFWTWGTQSVEPLSLLTSVGGETWREITVPSGDRMIEMASTPGHYVISGSRGSFWHSTDGESWEFIDLSSQTGRFGFQLAAGNGYFVAICERCLLVSEDGQSWTVDPRRHLSDVIFFQGRFYLVGEQGLVLRSNTPEISVPTVELSIAQLEGLWLINQRLSIEAKIDNPALVDHIDYYADSELIGRSFPPFDAFEWTPRRAGQVVIRADTISRSGVVAGASIVVDVGLAGDVSKVSAISPLVGTRNIVEIEGVFYAFGEGRVRISGDANHWEVIDLPVEWRRMNDEQFPQVLDVAGSATGSMVATLFDNERFRLATSPDGGRSWQEIEMPATLFGGQGVPFVSYGDGKFVLMIVSDDSQDRCELFRSVDGFRWSRQDAFTFAPFRFPKLAFGAGQFVVVASGVEGGAEIRTSVTGSEWTLHAAALDGWPHTLLFDHGWFVLQMENPADPTGFSLYSSTDGLDWAMAALSDGDPSLVLKGSGGGLFLAARFPTRVLATSVDGLTWTDVPESKAFFNRLGDQFAHGLGGWLTFPDSFYHSSNLRNWDHRFSSGIDDPGQVIAVSSGAGRTVIVGSGGLLSSTEDGLTWDAERLGNDDFENVVFGNGVFVATSRNGGLAESSTGRDWVLVEGESIPRFSRLEFGNGQFVGYDGDIRVSSDRRSWSRVSSINIAGQFPPQFAFAEGVWVGIDVDGTLFHSLDDGVSWGVGQVVNQAPVGSEWMYLFHDDGKFQAGCPTGCFESDDGVNWFGTNCVDHPVNFSVGSTRWSHGWAASSRFDADRAVYLSVDNSDWELVDESAQAIAKIGQDVFIFDSFADVQRVSLVDLRVTALTLPAEALALNRPFSVTVEIENAGFADLQLARNGLIEFVLSQNDIAGDADDILLAQVSSSFSLKKDQKSTLSVTIQEGAD